METFIVVLGNQILNIKIRSSKLIIIKSKTQKVYGKG